MRQKKSESLKKAATIVLALGIENASEVFKYLREEEIEALTVEIATMQSLSTDVMETTMDEFYGLCEAQTFITEGGIEYARAVLEKSKGANAAANIIEKVTKSLQVKAFDFIYKADPKQILILIQNEHPQTIALILSYCTVEQSSAILSELPRDIQMDVVERIATMDSTSPDIVKDIERLIERKMQMSETGEFTEIGGTKYIAEVLNSVDRGTEKYIMDELSKKDPRLSEEIRNSMFVFEDIAMLEPIYIQRFLQDVSTNDLLIALKGASKDVVDIFYSNMSLRMKETMEEESKYLRGVRLSDVEEKQQKLVALVRSLEDVGEIYVSRGRKDEIIV